MKNSGVMLKVAALALVGATAAARADALSTPAMSASLAANPNPFSIDTTEWLGPAGGKIYIGGAVSGLGYYQSSPTHLASGDASSYLDLSNAQVFVQKTDGWLQFYAQFGEYSMPTVGVPYWKSSSATPGSFGVVPVAYLKLQGEGDLSAFSIEGGKLPTLIGAEYTFTFQNLNIERGLLWNMEPAVSRGVQVNYASGPLTISASWNDGFYSNDLNVLSGLVSYGFNSGADTVVFAASGNLGSNFHFSVPNSGSIYNLIYTHTSGPWTISPYIQYCTFPKFAPFTTGAEMWGGALLVNYAIDDNWKLAGRVEYETTSGAPATAPNVIGYGAGSNAWSFTLTPTYQWKVFFARADLSYVTVGSGVLGSDGSPGLMFGTNGNTRDQVRGVLEVGVVF